MENSMEDNAAFKGNKENPISESQHIVVDDTAGSNSTVTASVTRQPVRRPFTSLSQVDSDLALARTLHEQERAYMMLRMMGERSEYASSLSGSYVYEDELDHLHDMNDVGSHEGEEEEEEEEEKEENRDNVNGENGGVGDEEQEEGENDDLFDMHRREDIDPAEFQSDEAYARALQDAEQRRLAVQMMAFAGINEWASDGSDENGSNSQDAWQDIDPDELSYEELLALGEAVGTHCRGLSADMIASLPSSIYKSTDSHNGTSELCVICRFDYEEGDQVVVLPCKHAYHSECISNWLQINKVCPVCSTEVADSTSQKP